MGAPYLGEIKLFSFGLIPKGWAACAGQIMSIQQNAALFSLFGTYYGGNGIGGDVNPLVTICPPGTTNSSFCYDKTRAAPPFRNGGPVGYGNTLSQLVTSAGLKVRRTSCTTRQMLARHMGQCRRGPLAGSAR